MFGRNKKNILVLVQKTDKQYIEIDRIKYEKDVDLIENKKHSIPKPPKNPYTFLSGKNTYLFFNVTQKKYIIFGEYDLGLSTEFLSSIFKRKIVGQLVKAEKNATEEPKTSFDFVKTALLYCGLILVGYLLGVQYGV